MRSPKRGNKFFLIFIIFQIVTAFAGAFIYSRYMLSQPGGKINISFIDFDTISQFLKYGFVFFLYLILTRQSVGEAIPHKKLSFTNIFLITAMVITIWPVCTIISSISSILSDNIVDDYMLMLYKSYPFGIIVIMVCVMPAVFEEVICRGIVLDNYRDISIKKAALVNGLFFGIFHFNLQQFFYAFFIGFLFTYFVRYTKSIYSSILAHFIFNFIQVGLIYSYISFFGITEYANSMAVESTTADLIQGLSFSGLLAIVTFPVFLILFFAFKRYNSTKNLVEDFLAVDFPEEDFLETDFPADHFPEKDFTPADAPSPNSPPEKFSPMEAPPLDFHPRKFSKFREPDIIDLYFVGILITYVAALEIFTRT